MQSGWKRTVSNYILTTEEVRDAFSTMEDDEATKDNLKNFDFWLVTERKRVAEMAIKKERARILAILEAAICDCDADCMRIDTTFSELQTKIEEL